MRDPANWIILAIVAILAISLGDFVARDLMPERLTDDQRAEAMLRVYELTQRAGLGRAPPAMSFDMQDEHYPAREYPHLYETSDQPLIAVATCRPFWRIEVNADRAARRWETFLERTLVHEMAHLVICERYPRHDWTAHGGVFASVVSELEDRAWHPN